jgi:hypothetical protein
LRAGNCEGGGEQKTLKKVEKTFEKPLDKRERMWYNAQALPLRLKSG